MSKFMCALGGKTPVRVASRTKAKQQARRYIHSIETRRYPQNVATGVPGGQGKFVVYPWKGTCIKFERRSPRTAVPPTKAAVSHKPFPVASLSEPYTTQPSGHPYR